MADIICTDCKRATEVVFDHSAGDTVCSECGLVLESRSVDETCEWRAFANDSGDHNPVRVGGAVNPLLSTGGLCTFISKTAGGGGGGGVLRTRLQNRASDPDRCIIVAFNAIAAMADRCV